MSLRCCTNCDLDEMIHLTPTFPFLLVRQLTLLPFHRFFMSPLIVPAPIFSAVVAENVAFLRRRSIYIYINAPDTTLSTTLSLSLSLVPLLYEKRGRMLASSIQILPAPLMQRVQDSLHHSRHRHDDSQTGPAKIRDRPFICSTRNGSSCASSKSNKARRETCGEAPRVHRKQREKRTTPGTDVERKDMKHFFRPSTRFKKKLKIKKRSRIRAFIGSL